MQHEQPVRIARFVDGDELREIYVATCGGGGAHVVQRSRGDLTLLSFGSKEVIQRLVLDARAVKLLAARMGWTCGIGSDLAGFFSHEDAALSDLLDICSRYKIACRFSISGTEMPSLSGGQAMEGRSAMRNSRLSLVP